MLSVFEETIKKTTLTMSMMDNNQPVQGKLGETGDGKFTKVLKGVLLLIITLGSLFAIFYSMW